MRVLFVNGHVWQSQRQREPPSSWLLVSGPEDDGSADGKVLAVGAGDAPQQHRQVFGRDLRRKALLLLLPPLLPPVALWQFLSLVYPESNATDLFCEP